MGRLGRGLIIVATTLALAACGAGHWAMNPSPMPVRAMHVALMHTGKVLLVAGSGNDRATFDAGTFRTSVWDPVTNTFTPVSTPWDAFCAGHAQLPDGRLLVAGGTGAYESSGGPTAFAGTNKAYVFDPDTDTYQAAPNMDNARWYPSLLTLGDGSVLAVAGQGSDGKLTYNSQKYFGGAWTPNQPPPIYDDASSTKQLWPLYPGLHLMADGRVFFSGAHTFGGTPSPGIWDLTANTFHPVGGLPDLHHTDHAMSVLLPPAQDQKVMIIGGGSDDGSLSTDSTSIVDLNDPNPQWTPAAKLDTPKMYVSAVILPDRTVFETGGALRNRDQPDSYVFSAQIFDPRHRALDEGDEPDGAARLPLLRAPAPGRTRRDVRQQPLERNVRDAHRDLLAGLHDQGRAPADHQRADRDDVRRQLRDDDDAGGADHERVAGTSDGRHPLE